MVDQDPGLFSNDDEAWCFPNETYINYQVSDWKLATSQSRQKFCSNQSKGGVIPVIFLEAQALCTAISYPKVALLINPCTGEFFISFVMKLDEKVQKCGKQRIRYCSTTLWLIFTSWQSAFGRVSTTFVSTPSFYTSSCSDRFLSLTSLEESFEVLTVIDHTGGSLSWDGCRDGCLHWWRTVVRLIAELYCVA